MEKCHSADNDVRNLEVRQTLRYTMKRFLDGAFILEMQTAFSKGPLDITL